MFLKIKLIVFLLLLSSSIMAQQSFNQALKLNGINQYIEIPNTDYLNIDGKHDFTLEIKFKPNILKPASLLSKFDVDSMGYLNRGFIFEVYKKGNINEYKVPEIFYGDYVATLVRETHKFNDGQYGTLNGTAIWDTLNWNQYTISRSAVLQKDWNEYDMINDNIFSRGYVTNPKNLSSNSPLYIGGYPPADSTYGNLVFYNGYIDEIRIWNRFRSKEDILALMNDTLDYKYYATLDSGLVAYYKFDAIEELKLKDGSTYKYCIRDLTPNKNHAKIINGGVLVNHDYLTSIKNMDKQLIKEFNLYQNYPNPFNPSTTIKYTIPKNGFVTLKVFDVLGREVASLVNKQETQGIYNVNFDASKLSSGVYFYILKVVPISDKSSIFISTKKMLLLK